jgi:cytochrome c1
MRTAHVAAIAVAAMASVIVAAPAADAHAPKPVKPKPPARTEFALTVANGEQARPVQAKASLTCGPAGGTHKLAKEACAALAAVNGDFAKLHVVKDQACTMIYDPVTVTAIGRWRGSVVRYEHTYGNACSLRVETGPVFGLS